MRLLPGRVALRAMAAKAYLCNGHVSKVSYLLDLRAEVWEDPEDVLPPTPDTVVTAERFAALQLGEARVEFQVGVGEREEGIGSRRLKASFPR
jgi:hypothetical protein